MHNRIVSRGSIAAATLASILSGPAVALAQTATASAQPAAQQTPEETRRATTTASGDTGLWFVPTGEVLPARRWSFSVYRVNFDYEQGFTDVSNFPVTFGVGLADRAEIFGALTAVNRIDRDVRPIFSVTGGAS